jgi:MFS family permease
MKNGILAGAIAGVIMGICTVIIGFISVFYIGFKEPTYDVEAWTPTLTIWLTLAQIALGIIWGSIFGAIYTFVYDLIPKKGIIKGLIYGLLLWLIKDIAAGSYTALMIMNTSVAADLIYYGFSMWIIYGIILGYLYKKQ